MKNYLLRAKCVFIEFTEKLRNFKKLLFLVKNSTALSPFCTQPISIISITLNSGSKGLSILIISAGSWKIQLTLSTKSVAFFSNAVFSKSF